MAQGDKKKKSNGGGQAPSAKKSIAADDKAEVKPAAPEKGADDKAEAKSDAPKKGADDKAEAKSDAPKKGADDKAGASKKGAGPRAVAARDVRAADADDGGKAKDHGGHGGHKPDIRGYLVIFGVLAVLTLLEVVVAQIPGLSKTVLGVLLVGMAVAKAAIVGLYYMHLKGETRILRLTVALPLAFPVIYAFILIAEGAWRLAR